MKKKSYAFHRAVAACIAVTASFFILLAGAFYVLIIAGAAPGLQSIWVCTAMTTYTHQNLATLLIPEDTIQRILAENRVNDTQHDSVILQFTKNEPEETESTLAEPKPDTDEKTEPPVDPYIEEGYTLWDTGIYGKEVSGTTWRGYMMLISDPSRVKVVDTSMQYSCGENVMTMVKNSGAVAGINGGGFQDGANYDSNGGMPAGLLIEDGQLVYPYSADDTTIYNMIGINKDGALVLRHCTAEWALKNSIVSCVSFYPFLVVNGEGLVKEGTGGWGIAPRTAIGQRESGEFLFLVIDGRQIDWSIGCDLDVLQDVMLQEKAYNAAMLDGGSSTAMVLQNRYVNRPSLGHERWINNAFVVMPVAVDTESDVSAQR